MKYGLVPALGLILICGCTKKPAQSAAGARPAEAEPSSAASASSASQPLDVEALVAREATGLAMADVKGPSGTFTSRVSAKAPPKGTATEGVAIVEIPIGSEAAVRCQVFPQEVDPGGTLSNLFAGARQKGVEFKRAMPWNVTVTDGAASAFVRALYVTNGPRGKAMGELKAMVHGHPGHTVLCLHDELGYEKTFTTVATEFVDHLVFPGKPAAASQYVAVEQARVRDVPLGFMRQEITKEGGKATRALTGFLMLPVSESELQFGDYYEVQKVDAAGKLELGVWVAATNNQIDLKIKVDQGPGGTYTYAGEAKGKPVSGTFTTKDKKPLPSYASTASALAPHARDGKPFSLDEVEYDPQLDPAAPVTVRYFRNPGDAAASVRIKKPNHEDTGTLDQYGFLEKQSTPLGPQTLEVSRVFVRGRP